MMFTRADTNLVRVHREKSYFRITVRILRTQLDLLIAMVLMTAVLPVAWLLSHSPLAIAHADLLDDSWQADIAYKSVRGVLLGRDVIFTYGPLYQLLISVPSRLLRFSVATFFATSHVVSFWIAIILTFLSARIAIGSQPAWKRSIFLVLVIVFWLPLQIRVFFELALFVLVVQSVLDLTHQNCNPFRPAITLAATILFGFMLSADTGAYLTMGVIIVLAAAGLLYRSSRRVQMLLASVALLTMVVVGLCGAVINLILGGGLLSYRFLRDAYHLVSTYRWIEPSAMGSLETAIFGIIVVAGIAILGAALLGSDRRSVELTRNPLFLFSALSFSLLLLQSGMVRSDWGHIIMGVYPLIWFSLAVLIGIGSAVSVRSAACLFSAIGVTALATGPLPSFVPRNVLFNYSLASARVVTACHGLYLDRACFGLPEGQTLVTAYRYLQQDTATTDSVFVYPYQNEVAVIARRNAAGGVLQNYIVGGDYLVNRQLDGLELQKPAHALYFTDSPSVLRVDDVTNFTRTPEVWFYMQSHYRTEVQIANDLLALVRDDRRAAEVHRQAVPIASSRREVSIIESPQTVDLGHIEWPPGSEFLKIGMTVRYPFWWRFRKPSQLIVEVELADGSHKQTHVVIPPNTVTDVWVYPWNEEDLAKYLDPQEAVWQQKAGAAVAGIKLIVQREDWISVTPSSLVIYGMDGISLRNGD